MTRFLSYRAAAKEAAVEAERMHDEIDKRVADALDQLTKANGAKSKIKAHNVLIWARPIDSPEINFLLQRPMAKSKWKNTNSIWTRRLTQKLNPAHAMTPKTWRPGIPFESLVVKHKCYEDYSVMKHWAESWKVEKWDDRH